MSESRLYGGRSSEERRRTRDRQLREACLDVVAEHGVPALTAAQVCARAGLSKRYFYESFTDRDALLVAVLEDLFRQVNRAVVAALLDAGPTRADRSRATIGALTDLLASDARLARLYVEAADHQPLRRYRSRAYHRYAGFWLHVVHRHPAPGPADRLAALHFIAGTTDVLCSWLTGELDLDRGAVIEELADLGARAVPAAAAAT